jgi:hypothetical protein
MYCFFRSIYALLEILNVVGADLAAGINRITEESLY